MKHRVFVLFLVLLSAVVAFAEKKDYSNQISVASLVDSDEYNSDQATQASTDVSDFDGVGVIISTGSGSYDASNGLKFYLAESNDDSTYNNVAAGDILGEVTNASGAILVINASQTTPQIKKYGYVGAKKYLKMTVDFIGNATATISAIAVKGLPHIAPISGN